MSKEGLKKRKVSCRLCRAKNSLTKHHIKPRRYGGQIAGNYIWLCRKCHDEAEEKNYTKYTPDGIWHIDSATNRSFKIKNLTK